MAPLQAAIKAVVVAHNWGALTAPLTVRTGPVVDGDVAMPAVGIVNDEATDFGADRARDKWLAHFHVMLAVPLGVLTPPELNALLLAYRDQIRALVRTSGDGRWGLGATAVGETLVKGWNVHLTDSAAVIDVTFDVPVYDITITTPAPAIIDLVAPVTFSLAANKVKLFTASFQPGATGIISISYLLVETGALIGSVRTTNDGNPVTQAVTQGGIANGTEFYASMTIDATDGVFLDRTTPITRGPFTMTAGGGTYDGDLYSP